MKLLIFIVVGIVAGLLVLAGIIALIGSRLPKSHVASRSIHLRRSPQDVYAVVRDFGSAPKWRADRETDRGRSAAGWASLLS